MKIGRMFALLALGVFAAGLPALAQPAPGGAGGAMKPPVIFPTPMSPRNANYTISVTLDAKTHRLTGTEHIVWRNITDAPARDAWFHLYLNAFANDHTVFMTESGGQLRGMRFNDKNWGYCSVKSIALAGPDGSAVPLEQLFPREDHTVMRVELPEPVPPGGDAAFDVSFEDQLPHVFARSGYAGTFNMAGQWFPKLGVFQGDKGWNCHEYHANTEFFSDFGVYNVSITVPADYVVGATGILWREVRNGKLKTLSFHAEDVHDFAWSAQPDFVDRSETWEGIKIRVLMQPGNRGSIPIYFASVKRALADFAKWIWKYPYPEITVIDPPLNGMGAGGMEYPTLITAGTTPFFGRSILMPQITVVHEFGHQYWYGMEANNEFERAWLDEGINSYYEARIMDEWYGSKGSFVDDLWGWSLGERAQERMAYLSTPAMDPIVRDAWKYYSNGSYAAITYDKTALVLKTLENILGQKEMDRVMRAFFMQVRFTHPDTREFIRIVSKAAGRDLTPILEPMLYGTGTVDFRVVRVRNMAEEKPTGYDLSGTAPRLYSKEKAGGKKASAGNEPGKKAGKKDGKEPATVHKTTYASTVVVERRGSLVLPVDVKVTFADGGSKVVHWDGDGRYTTWRFTGPRVVRVVADPDDHIPLDLNRLNNDWVSEGDGSVARCMTTRSRTLYQTIAAILFNVL